MTLTANSSLTLIAFTLSLLCADRVRLTPMSLVISYFCATLVRLTVRSLSCATLVRLKVLYSFCATLFRLTVLVCGRFVAWLAFSIAIPIHRPAPDTWLCQIHHGSGLLSFLASFPRMTISAQYLQPIHLDKQTLGKPFKIRKRPERTTRKNMIGLNLIAREPSLTSPTLILPFEPSIFASVFSPDGVKNLSHQRRPSS
jgi:hypothetical protein